MADEPKNDQPTTRIIKLNVSPKPVAPSAPQAESAPPPATPDAPAPRRADADKRLATKKREPYRFLNPYNFVRYLSQPRRADSVLGDCPPPPHDRYVGLSGRLTCELMAVSPLFIADAHAVDLDEEKDHRTYFFFEYDDQLAPSNVNYALPASSLRGMLRAVFEAATNSCLAVLADRRLSKHWEAEHAPWLVPARVEREGDEWKLRLLTGTSVLRINDVPQDKQYAAWVFRYTPLEPSKTLKKDPAKANKLTRRFQQRTSHGREVDLNDFTHGQKCFALLQATDHPHPEIKFWDVVELSLDPQALRRQQRGEQHIVEGWLCLTNQNIEAKHSERFFFRAPENLVGSELVELPEPVRRAYEELIADYQDRHRKGVERRGSSAGEPLARSLRSAALFVIRRQKRWRTASWFTLS